MPDRPRYRRLRALGSIVVASALASILGCASDERARSASTPRSDRASNASGAGPTDSTPAREGTADDPPHTSSPPLADRPEPSAQPSGSTSVLYRSSGWTWRDDFLRVDHVIAGRALDSMWSPEDGTGDTPCRERACGRARIPPRLPTEVGFWLALADQFRRRSSTPGSGDGRPGEVTARRLQSQHDQRRSRRAGDDSRRTVLRELLAFEPTDAIDCRAEFALFELDELTRTSVADRALETAAPGANTPAVERNRRSRLKLTPSPEAHYFAELRRRPKSSAPEWELRIWTGGDFEDRPTGRSRLVRRTLICRSDAPLFARETPWIRTARASRNAHALRVTLPPVDTDSDQPSDDSR